MDGVQQLDEIMPLIEAVVDQIPTEQLDASTACTGFTVAGVLEHMIAGATIFSPAFRGEAPSEAGPPEGSVHDRWHAAMDELLASMHADGAQERIIAAPIGEVPGAVFARFVAFDGLIHGWDLATATGQPYAPRDELVAEVGGFARQALQPEMRDGDTFAAETRAPADATPLEQLVAFTGRSVPDKEHQP
jgi:uncharacterized protein (TIGR03086 family)